MGFNQVFYNSLHSPTELCSIGKKYGTDKSPFVKQMGCHSYTPFYNLLFSNIRYRPIIFGEIGIYKNASMKMWREYFPHATLYGWDCKLEENLDKKYEQDYVELAKNDNLNNVTYDYMNCREETSINQAFEKTNTKFDVIIDDASHKFWDQIRVIRNAYEYLNPGGYLIVEDLGHRMYEYCNEIETYGHSKYYSNITHVRTCASDQKYGFDTDELLVLIKK